MLLIPLLAGPPARSAGFIGAIDMNALIEIQAQLREVAQTPQKTADPLVIPDVGFGDKKAARYRYRRRDEIFYLEGGKRPVTVGWETSDVVETSDGDVERLLSVEPGTPPSAQAAAALAREQAKVGAEAARLTRLLADADAKAKLQRKERSDEEGLEKMVDEFPRALRYAYEGTEQGPGGELLVRESFESNDCSHTPHVDPCFTPRSQEARIYEGMKGEIWVRARDKHMVRMHTVIDHDVKFGWGPFTAKAKQGGSIDIGLTDVDGAGRRWVIDSVDVHLTVEKSALAALFSGGTERDHDRQAMSGFVPAPAMDFDSGLRLLLKGN